MGVPVVVHIVVCMTIKAIQKQAWWLLLIVGELWKATQTFRNQPPYKRDHSEGTE